MKILKKHFDAVIVMLGILLVFIFFTIYDGDYLTFKKNSILKISANSKSNFEENLNEKMKYLDSNTREIYKKLLDNDEYVDVCFSHDYFVALTRNESLVFGSKKDVIKNNKIELIQKNNKKSKKLIHIKNFPNSLFDKYGGHCVDVPTDGNYVKIVCNLSNSFAALKNDGSISVWGYPDTGGFGTPIDKGYMDVVANQVAFAAIKSNGSITSWGLNSGGGRGEPFFWDRNYKKIIPLENGFVGIKENGFKFIWGH